MAVGVHNDEARGFLSEGFGERPIPWLSGLPTCSTDTGTMVPLWQDRLNSLPQQPAGRVEAFQVVTVELALFKGKTGLVSENGC